MIALLCLVFTVIAEPSRSLRGVAGGEDPLPEVFVQEDHNDSQNKMFFWPIWTKSGFHVSEKPLVKETPKPSSASVADGVQSELEDPTPTDGAPADGEQTDVDAKMWFWY